MNLRMPNERLVRLISRYSRTALESRQVARRLWSLLPTRYRELKWEHSRGRGASAKTERHALVDPRYQALVTELTEMSYAAMLARVEYETHTMLYKARQSLGSYKSSKVR